MRAPNHSQALPSQQRHWQTPCKGQSEKIREACLVSQDMSKYDNIYSSTHGFWFLALVLGPRAIMSAKVPPLQSSMTLQMLWEAAAKVSFTKLGHGPSARTHLFEKLHTILQRTWWTCSEATGDRMMPLQDIARNWKTIGSGHGWFNCFAISSSSLKCPGSSACSMNIPRFQQSVFRVESFREMLG